MILPWGHCKTKPLCLSPRTALWLNLMTVREFVPSWSWEWVYTGGGSCTSAVRTDFLLQETLKAEGRK